MKPIRVLQVVTHMNRGGLETMLMNYYRAMDRSELQFDFMVHREAEGHYDSEILRLGGRIYRMPMIKPGNYLTYFSRLRQFFREHPDYPAVHAHINENSSFVLRAAREAGVPCRIAHSHLSDLGLDFKLPFRLYARTVLKGQPTHYFACSRKAGEWLYGKQRGAASQTTVLNNAVHVEEFRYSEAVRREIRAELGLEDQLVVGHIGRFNKQKNHDFLIDIFKALHDESPHAVLLLAGDGHLRPAIESKVRSLGLTSSVRFLGVRTDIPRLLQAMDVFLFPSLFEGLPVVLVEAQAAGLRCVVSDTITRETDVTGRLDFLSLKEAPDGWARALVRTSCGHVDTSRLLRDQGYDTGTMARWLADFYVSHGIQAASGVESS